LKRIASRNLGITFLILTLVIRFVFWLSPALFEAIYFQHIFPTIRQMQSVLDFIWFVPGFYFLLVFLLGWLILRFPKQKKAIKKFLLQFANLIGGLTALFMLLFGYQYLDKGFAERINLSKNPIEANLIDEYIAAMDRAMNARNGIPELQSMTDVTALTEWPSNSEIQNQVAKVLSMYPARETPIQMVQFKPGRTLRRLGISGIYNPFSGEANVESSLPSIQNAYVSAHEMAHAMGITSEAEANFVAYLACVNSQDPFLIYAGEFALWRQIAQEINKTYPVEVRNNLRAIIPNELMADRMAILNLYRQSPAYFPEVTENMNDAYLKLQGIEAGADDYDGFLKLYLAWAETQG
jgi:hypothetical protein